MSSEARVCVGFRLAALAMMMKELKVFHSLSTAQGETDEKTFKFETLCCVSRSSQFGPFPVGLQCF